MNKRELIAQTSEGASLTRAQAAKALDVMLEAVTKALAKGQTVAITGFGSFSVTRRSERVCRNPKTGEQVSVPASRTPRFRPSKILKDAQHPPKFFRSGSCLTPNAFSGEYLPYGSNARKDFSKALPCAQNEPIQRERFLSQRGLEKERGCCKITLFGIWFPGSPESSAEW